MHCFKKKYLFTLWLANELCLWRIREQERVLISSFTCLFFKLLLLLVLSWGLDFEFGLELTLGLELGLLFGLSLRLELGLG